MRADDFRTQCLATMNHLLTQGFVRPISFAAIASDGLATLGSSETVIEPPAELGVKTHATHGPLHLYLLPLHVLFIDAQGHAAYTLTDGAGSTSLQMLS
jgi:hypothetical protein